MKNIIFVRAGCLDEEIAAVIAAKWATKLTVIDSQGSHVIATHDTDTPNEYTIHLYKDHIDPDIDLTGYGIIYTMGATTPLSDNTVSKLQSKQLALMKSAEELLNMFGECWGPFVDHTVKNSPAYFMCQEFKDHAPIDQIKAIYHGIHTSKMLTHIDKTTLHSLIAAAINHSQCYRGVAFIDIGSMGNNDIIEQIHVALREHYDQDVIASVHYFRMINNRPIYFVSLQAPLTQMDRAEKVLERMYRTEYERIPNETMYQAIGTCYELVHFGEFWFGPEI